MSTKIITDMDVGAFSRDAIARIENRRLKYCLVSGEIGSVKVRYFYPAQNGSELIYATIAGSDKFTGRNRTAKAIAHAKKYVAGDYL